MVLRNIMYVAANRKKSCKWCKSLASKSFYACLVDSFAQELQKALDNQTKWRHTRSDKRAILSKTWKRTNK